jgi:sporulation protein YlmC with PRC-barrel domain
MTRTRNLMVALSIVGVLLASGSFAQESEQPPVPRASIFIGSQVINPQGEALGKIEDLVLDPIKGRIKYAALSYGSILGFGGKLFAVPWEALKLAPNGKTFILDVSKEQLEASAGFDDSAWPSRPDSVLRAAASDLPKPSEKMAPTGTGASRTAAARQAQETVMSGTVAAVDVPGERLTLKAAGGKAVELQAPVEMLNGLQSGDVVEVKIAGTRATEIHKQKSGSSSDTGNMQQLQPRHPEQQN